MNSLKLHFLKLKALVWKRRTLYFLVPALIVIFLIMGGGDNTTSATEVVTLSDVRRTVLATGEVTSTIDLPLSFQRTGTVKDIQVTVGDTVTKGTILARLVASAESAEVTQAQGALLKAEAEYDAEVEVTENEGLKLENAKKEQDTLVANAYRTLLSDSLIAVPDSSNEEEEAPTISGSYSCEKEGAYTIELYASNTASGASFRVTGLEDASGSVLTENSEAIGDCGLFISFPEGHSNTSEWTIEIPNTQSTSYIANLNAYELAVETQQKIISELESDLGILEAQGETVEMKIAYANLVSAQGAYQLAVAKLEETIIRAPTEGTVTKIDATLGQVVEAHEEIVVVQDVGNLYVEANINESNILAIEAGQKVEITFDAATTEIFEGLVEYVDIAPTVISDVVNYTVTTRFLVQDPRIRPGMTANMTVIIREKTDVLSVPLRMITTKDGISTILVATKDDPEKFNEQIVSLGDSYDGNRVEIVSGLSEGDSIREPQ